MSSEIPRQEPARQEPARQEPARQEPARQEPANLLSETIGSLSETIAGLCHQPKFEVVHLLQMHAEEITELDPIDDTNFAAFIMSTTLCSAGSAFNSSVYSLIETLAGKFAAAMPLTRAAVQFVSKYARSAYIWPDDDDCDPNPGNRSDKAMRKTVRRLHTLFAKLETPPAAHAAGDANPFAEIVAKWIGSARLGSNSPDLIVSALSLTHDLFLIHPKVMESDDRIVLRSALVLVTAAVHIGAWCIQLAPPPPIAAPGAGPTDLEAESLQNIHKWLFADVLSDEHISATNQIAELFHDNHVEMLHFEKMLRSRIQNGNEIGRTSVE